MTTRRASKKAQRVAGEGNPAGGRRNARRKTFELLFELEQHPGLQVDRILERSFNDPDVLVVYTEDEDADGYVVVDAQQNPAGTLVSVAPKARKLQRFVSELVQSVKQNEVQIDIELSKHPHEWSFERIGTVERVLMRMAVAEMVYLGTAHKVVINEILDLAKLYAQDDAVKFINGILGAVVRNLDEMRQSALAVAPPGSPLLADIDVAGDPEGLDANEEDGKC